MTIVGLCGSIFFIINLKSFSAFETSKILLNDSLIVKFVPFKPTGERVSSLK